ncbi:MAG: hypothetical protein DMF63_06785 [Acidobacteria bacterium]|nr:MAG: hypothetical protein DMF63_06785 [Acidobacteriota bacterium]
MKTHFLLVLVISLGTACGSPSNNDPSNTLSNQNANSASTSSGDAGKAATPSPSPSKDEASKTVTVKFPTGATQASYTDSFSGYGYIDYIFDAKADQNLTAEITKADGNKAMLSVMRNGDSVETDSSEVQGWTGVLPANGRYIIRVGQMRDDARTDNKPVKFSLLISITD